MATPSFSRSLATLHAAADFLSALRTALTWRAVLATQTLAALYALTEWLEQGSHAAALSHLIGAQAMTALLVMLAALAGDEMVRRGWKVLSAFALAVLCTSAANAATQWMLHRWFADMAPARAPVMIANDFFNVGVLWGTALLVYLNRQSAARLLAHLRAQELERAEAERRVITSRLAATESRMDCASVLRKMSEASEQFAAGHAGADASLENLISTLREKAAHAVAAGQPVTQAQAIRSP